MSEEPEVKKITEADLKKAAPKGLVLPKGLGPRADLLYTTEKTLNAEMREVLKPFEIREKFCKLLREWFIQELPAGEASATGGKVGHVEVVRSEVATVSDWPKFYAHIIKKKAFELLNKAVNQAAVKEVWGEGKAIPGVTKFQAKKLSLTKAKGSGKGS